MATVTASSLVRDNADKKIRKMRSAAIMAHRENTVPGWLQGEAALHKALHAALTEKSHHTKNKQDQLAVGPKNFHNLTFRYKMPDGSSTGRMLYTTTGHPPSLIMKAREVLTVPADVQHRSIYCLTVTRKHATHILDEYLPALDAHTQQEAIISNAYDAIKIQVCGLLYHLGTVNEALEAFPEIKSFLPDYIVRMVNEEDDGTLDNLPKEWTPDNELLTKTAAAAQILGYDKE